MDTYVEGGIEVGKRFLDYGKVVSQNRADEAEIVTIDQVQAGLYAIEGTARKLLHRRFMRAANAFTNETNPSEQTP